MHLPIISPGDTPSLNKKQAYDDDDDNLNITCLYHYLNICIKFHEDSLPGAHRRSAWKRPVLGESSTCSSPWWCQRAFSSSPRGSPGKWPIPCHETLVAWDWGETGLWHPHQSRSVTAIKDSCQESFKRPCWKIPSCWRVSVPQTCFNRRSFSGFLCAEPRTTLT